MSNRKLKNVGIERKFIPSVETLKEKKGFVFMKYINRLSDFSETFLTVFQGQM